MPPAYEVLLLNTAIPQIQAAQSGDTYVVPRDIAFSAALTLSAGTANGVPYLNGSKVLTTGSALTFDGTNLDLATVGAKVNFATTGSATRNYVGVSADGYSLEMVMQRGASQPLSYKQNFAVGHEWGIAGSTPMTLDTSGNLGVGATSLNKGSWGKAVTLESTTSEAYELVTNGTYMAWFAAGGSSATIGTKQAHPFVFYTSDTERARITSTGQFQWSPDGSTQAMTLDASGNLIVGDTATSSSAKTYVKATSGSSDFSNNATLFLNAGTETTTANLIRFNGAVAKGLVFGRAINADSFVWGFTNTTTPVMTLDASGNLLVGTQTSGDGLLEVSTGAATTAQLINTASGNYNLKLWNQATSGDNSFVLFITEGGGGTARGSITYNRAGGLVVYNTTSDYRAKDIIGPVTNPGATIDALKVYEGKMKGATQSRPMLVAHEAQEHAPYAVTGEKDAVNEDGTPKYQQMDVSSLVPLLLAEIQSLRARVAQLEGK